MVRDIIIFIYGLGLVVINIFTKIPTEGSVIMMVSFLVFYLVLVLPEIIKPNSAVANFLTRKLF